LRLGRFGPPTDWPLEAEDYPLLAAVLLLPWAFGGVELWAFRSAAFLIAVAAAIALNKNGWAGLGLDRRSIWLLPALLMGLWAAVQLVPLPPPVVALLSPTADAIYRDSFPGYPGEAPDNVIAGLEASALAQVPEADGLPGPPRNESFFHGQEAGRWSGFRPLSLLPTAGVERIHWYFALLLAFLLIRARTRDPDAFHHYRNALFFGFFGLAVFGLVQAATFNGKIFWVRATIERANPFGPYVNPVNFAGAMELAVPWLAGYAFMVARRTGGGWLALFRSPIFACGALLCTVAGLATASKFAAPLLIGSLSLLALLSASSLKRRLQWLAGIAVVWVGAFVVLSTTRLGERTQEFIDAIGGDLGEARRLVSWKASTAMIQDFPLTGSGFGSFREVFPRYIPSGEPLTWNQLHNDYLEVLVEGGLVAAVLLVWLVLAFWWRVVRSPDGHSRSALNLEHIGMLMGLGALSIHAFVDFNHQIPGNALLFVALGAMAVARGEVSLPDED